MTTLRRLSKQDLPAYQALMLGGVSSHPDRFRLTAVDVESELLPLRPSIRRGAAAREERAAVVETQRALEAGAAATPGISSTLRSSRVAGPRPAHLAIALGLRRPR